MVGKILVVDDSKLVTDIVRMRLSMYGYDVQLAHSGEEALQMIADDVPDEPAGVRFRHDELDVR